MGFPRETRPRPPPGDSCFLSISLCCKDQAPGVICPRIHIVPWGLNQDPHSPQAVTLNHTGLPVSQLVPADGRAGFLTLKCQNFRNKILKIIQTNIIALNSYCSFHLNPPSHPVIRALLCWTVPRETLVFIPASKVFEIR
ncbi:HEAT repeat-containing protein 5A [Platysternon megacephalum]|uniref:HEAT repeat-containing protein 5A n=1 Tax=Platysternon megacephalum TaxID=55544 RepID=A0A4D9EUQ8_9SAUR|nr:HEAT repeat-containing protein 5A [Platysternon megacephalum]